MAQQHTGQSPAPSQVGFSLFGGGSRFSRRSLLRSTAVGAGALTVPSLLAGCGDDKPSTTNSGTGGTGGKTVSIGSNYSDAVPKQAMQAVVDAYQTKSGKTVKVNTVDHNTFQESINRYLQGSPEDIFTWFAGFRMQFFAAQGLAGDISDAWSEVGSGFSEGLKAASTGADGKQYFVPFYSYPWAVFYRKSVFEQKGYTPPKTLDQFKALGDQMKKDGLIPLAFAEKDGWPAMGTFDYINMRSNGYDFHVNLMAGKESWEDPKVKAVFDTWRGLMPYHQPAANGRTWQEAAQSLLQKKSGMYVLGAFVGEQFAGADQGDLDFFPFPEINPQFGQDAVEAPIDGFMMSKKAKDPAAAKDFLKFLGTPEAEITFLKSSPNNVAAHKSADTSSYTPLQKKSAELIGAAKHISQFMDRDTRPDFASTVMIPALQSFVNNPNDIDGLTKSIEAQKKTIFAS
jgi:multiple sugar transport system substrate-binding protein